MIFIMNDMNKKLTSVGFITPHKRYIKKPCAGRNVGVDATSIVTI